MSQTTRELLANWTHKARRDALTRAFFGITEKWKLTNEKKAALLGWSYQNKRSVMDSMKSGKRGVSLDADKLQRMIEVLNIHKNLRMLFPHNREPVYAWVKQKREVFGNHSALDVMVEHGNLGIMAVRRYLDHARTA